MSLINCPECGRENVSSEAVACPDCGYNIKEYCTKKRNEEIRKMEAEERRRRYDPNSYLDEIVMPNKPKFFTFGWTFILVLAIIILKFAVDFENDFYVFYGFGLALFSLCRMVYNYKKNVFEYELAHTDFEEYRQMKAEKIAEDIIKKDCEEQEMIRNCPSRCPNCNSYNTEEILNGERALSVAWFGVASGKIGKQYKCKTCGHMW